VSATADLQPARDWIRDRPGLILEPTWLKEMLGRPHIRPVDLRDADAYRTAHIAGAAYLELRRLGTSVGKLENALLPPSEFSDLMAELGISSGDVVVAYDDQWGLAAARLLWALHYYGHRDVAVLNGGWDGWVDEGGPQATGDEAVTPGHFEATPRSDVYADTEWIAERIRAGGTALVDTRTKAEFDAGHIPGAIWWDWFNAVPAGSWNVSRDPAELRAEWQALGLSASDHVTVYCRSGMRAAHTYLVLRNAGFSQVRLYDGSWQEWSMTMDAVDGQ
jgi:thiosulfate/3-mercaptopyruvate sulfurtransferase